ncbi:unnamed protein product [Effrenium voratum]|nr:unnamed protein product [Effrenium voratum]CAJ1423923.1 unnamed protein product [Effrenium voratum]
MARRSAAAAFVATAAFALSLQAFVAPAPVARAPGAAAAGTSIPKPGTQTPAGVFAATAGLLALAGRQLCTCRSAEGKINNKISPEVPKVVTKEDLKEGDKKVYCRCWLSGTFPLCDGSHQKHNEATGDNVGPLIVGVKKSG